MAGICISNRSNLDAYADDDRILSAKEIRSDEVLFSSSLLRARIKDMVLQDRRRATPSVRVRTRID